MSGFVFVFTPTGRLGECIAIVGEAYALANYRAGMSSPTDVIMHFRIGDHAQQSMDAMSMSAATTLPICRPFPHSAPMCNWW